MPHGRGVGADLHRSMLQSQALSTTTAWALEEVMKYKNWMANNPEPVAGADDNRSAVDVLRHKAYENIVARYLGKNVPDVAQTAAVLHLWEEWPEAWQVDFKAVYDGLRVGARLRESDDMLPNQITKLQSGEPVNLLLQRMMDHAAVIPASSASQERVFSALTRALDTSRRASSPALVQARVLYGLRVKAVASQINNDRVAKGQRSIGQRQNVARVLGNGAAMAQHAEEYVQIKRGVWVSRESFDNLPVDGPQKRPRRGAAVDIDDSDDSDVAVDSESDDSE